MEQVTTKETVAAAPKRAPYGEEEYWEKRYRSESDVDEFDWLCGADELCGVVSSVVGENIVGKVLHVGCGTSNVGPEMIRQGLCQQVVNLDSSLSCVERMREKYEGVTGCTWVVGDAMQMDVIGDESMELVLDKGTLDALACKDEGREEAGRSLIAEAYRVLRPGGSLVIASFGPPQIRWRYMRDFEGAKAWATARHESLRIEASGSELHVYTLTKAPRTAAVELAVARRRSTFETATWVLGIAMCAVAISLGQGSARRRLLLAASQMRYSSTTAEEDPLAGVNAKGESVPQCNYDMLRSFAKFAQPHDWSLGAGTLLGALRTEPPGLLRWEHDVDVYMPAPAAFDLLARLERQCGGAHSRGKACGVLEFRGHVDAMGAPCCGFGFKIFHALTPTACELDVLVLADSGYAPLVHQETALWPLPLGPLYARAKDAVYRSRAFDAGNYDDSQYLVIPEDFKQKQLLSSRPRWTRDLRQWLGPPVSFFHSEYFKRKEFEPLRTMKLYDVEVKIPANPWASLNRTYGEKCSYIARVDEHGGLEADLRKPENAHLKKPARVVTGPPRRR